MTLLQPGLPSLNGIFVPYATFIKRQQEDRLYSPILSLPKLRYSQCEERLIRAHFGNVFSR